MYPTLQIDITSGIFIGDFFGFILALPIALFLAFWISAVKNRWVVVIGAFVGALLGFLGILGWVGTLIYDTPLPGVDAGPTFFGSLFMCAATGLVVGILSDLIIARMNSRDYSRHSQQPIHG